MKYVKSFEEVFFRDTFRISSNSGSEMETRLKSQQNKEFDFMGDLIKYVTLSDLSKVKIHWYDSPEHDIKQKVKDRTHLKSIREFNNVIKEVVKNIFEKKIIDVNKKNKYEVKSEKYALSLIMSINIKSKRVVINSILSGVTASKSYKKIYI